MTIEELKFEIQKIVKKDNIDISTVNIGDILEDILIACSN